MNHSPKNRLVLCLGSVALLTCGGCVNVNETVYQERNRVPVEFESEHAANTFYDAMHRPTFQGLHSSSQTNLQLPIVFSHSRTVKAGENMIFNHAVAVADTNRDQVISESEAHIFSERY